MAFQSPHIFCSSHPGLSHQVFHEVEQRSDHAFSVHLSFLEIYNETLVDLLASVRGCPGVGPGGMAVVEEAGGGVSVRGLSLHPVHSEEAALNLLFEVSARYLYVSLPSGAVV